MSDAGDGHWRVGELAEATGLTVRALHHYDEIGLLAPTERTGAGHRLYGEAEVRRLYRILALRRLGLRLDEIAALLDEGGLSLAETVRRHLEQVERSLDHQQRLRRRLAEMLDALDRSLEPSIDQFIEALEAMAVIEATVEDVVVPVEPCEHLSQCGPVMLLSERDGERVLPIWIGHPEATALAMQLGGIVTPRPMGSDLTVRLVEATGARIARVSVSGWREGTFYATVTLVAGDACHEIDARPSDAMNLAARVRAPIFVDAQIMDACGVPSRGGDVEERINQWHRQESTGPQGPTAWRSLLPSSEGPAAAGQ